MPDHPTENHGSSLPPFAGAPAEPAPRELSEILAELAQATAAGRGDASVMRGAVAELSRALAALFEMIRADRADQAARITELEQALHAAEARLTELERGEDATAAVPTPTDFDALRGAAERLRASTEQLVRDQGTPADDRRAATDLQRIARHPGADPDDAAETADAVTERSDAPPPEDEETYPRPGVLRVFPGAVLRADLAEDLDIESELVFDERPGRASASMPVPFDLPPEPGDHDRAGTRGERGDADGGDTRGGRAAASADAEDAPGGRPALKVRPRPEPVVVPPRPARKRRPLRRRRIDARKLRGVDPAAALRAMVSAVDDLWTAGTPLDLVVAFTDGGTLRVSGGDRVPLQVDDVPAGTSGRCTVTATSAQIVPLFGRLDLDETESAPLIHGTRRDADLLVGWIDRAQRLTAEPL